MVLPRGVDRWRVRHQEAVQMDEITSNRHAGVIIISFAIVILGLMSTLFG
jgi:hypothetical protein